MGLSIIIINWNSRDFLRDCLASIEQNRPPFPHEVIVIDNASYDGAAEMVQRDFPEVRFLQSADNLGFARGNNAAAAAATSRVLLFLNPDTKVLGNVLAGMVQCLDSLSDSGILGCRILNADGTVQTTAIQAFPTLLNQLLDAEAFRARFPRSRLWGIAPLFSTDKTPVPVDMVSGACLMIRRDVFDRIGGFSSDYFMYSEDVDICKKAKDAGWKSYYLPTASIIHYNGQSTKKQPSYFSCIVHQQSRFSYFKKMRGHFYACCFRATQFLVALVRIVLVGGLWTFSRHPEKRAQLQYSLGKWKSILQWSLGMEKPVGTQSAASRVAASS